MTFIPKAILDLQQRTTAGAQTRNSERSENTALPVGRKPHLGTSYAFPDWDSEDEFVLADESGSIKADRDPVDQGADLLSIEVEKKLLNRSAPSATQQVRLIASSVDCKALAADATAQLQDDEAHDGSLHSPIMGEDCGNGCADDRSDEEPDDYSTYNPDFYQVRVDLFNNTGTKNSTNYRAKLRVRPHASTPDSEAIEYMADFYNRPRDINTRIAAMGHESHIWYAQLKAEFQQWKAIEGDWIIPPKMAILKHLARDGNMVNGEPMEFAGAVLAHAAGEPHPVMKIFYCAWTKGLTLDDAFTSHRRTNLINKGFYRDEKRADQDVETTGKRPRAKQMRF